MNTSNMTLRIPVNTPLTKIAEAADAMGYDFVMDADIGPAFITRPPALVVDNRPDPHLEALADCAFVAITDPHFMRNLILGLLMSTQQEWRPLVAGLQRVVVANIANNAPSASGAAFAIARTIERVAAETISVQLHDQVLPKWLQPQAS